MVSNKSEFRILYITKQVASKANLGEKNNKNSKKCGKTLGKSWKNLGTSPPNSRQSPLIFSSSKFWSCGACCRPFARKAQKIKKREEAKMASRGKKRPKKRSLCDHLADFPWFFYDLPRCFHDFPRFFLVFP